VKHNRAKKSRQALEEKENVDDLEGENVDDLEGIMM
jgi:hypothetical protein